MRNKLGQLQRLSSDFRRFVFVLSGANEEVLELVPTERARFESLGWALLITSGMAAVSMWFALSTAMGLNGILAFPAALLWGLVIMGIDRWLITSMPVDSNRKFAMAVPRVALALLLGTLISTPFVLRIFESEINAQIAVIQQKSYDTFLQQQQSGQVTTQVNTYYNELQYLNRVVNSHGADTGNSASDPQLVAYSKQLTNLNSELTHWTGLKATYYNEYICQLYGGPACPKKGDGPAAKDSQQNYQAASQEVDTIKAQINHVQGEIQQRDAQLSSTSKTDQQNRYQEALEQRPLVQAEYNTAVQRKNELQAGFFAHNQAAHGILIRLEALSQLSNGNFTVTAARFLLFLLFLVIELLPVTVKLLQKPSLYEEALAEAKEAERRHFSRYYRRSRGMAMADIGPGRTPMLQLRPEPEPNIQQFWHSTRRLPIATGDYEDEQPTENIFRNHEWSQGPGGQPGYGPPGPPSPASRPQQQWDGPDRWRNKWPGQPVDGQPVDGQPDRGQLDRGQLDHGQLGGANRVAEAPPDLRFAQTRPDYSGQRSDPTRNDAYPPQGGVYYHEADRQQMAADRAEDWPDQSDHDPAGDDGLSSRSDGNGSGTPLTWDDDE